MVRPARLIRGGQDKKEQKQDVDDGAARATPPATARCPPCRRAPPASPPRALLPPWQREWLAASMGCTIADAMFNPLEVLKVRRQMLARRASSTTASNAAAAAATASATAPPTGTLALARDAIKSRGLANGLWLPGLEATCYRALLLHRVQDRHVSVRRVLSHTGPHTTALAW